MTIDLTTLASEEGVRYAVRATGLLAEFGDDQTLILYPGENGAPEETTLGELLPHAFRLEYLA